MSKQYKTLVFDGNNILFRAFFTKRPDNIINGINVTPIHQFLSMVKASVKRFRPEKIVFTWDKRINSTKPNFRKELVPYKEQRVENEKTVELHQTIEHIQKFIDTLGIETIYPMNMEADDVIRYVAKNYEGPMMIVSSDKDLLQLVSEHVHILLPSKDIIVTLDNFEEVATVPKNLFILYKAILGDVSDNIKGLDRYGPVKAKALAQHIRDNNNFYDTDLITDEQRKIVERNIHVIDLRFAEEFCGDEYAFYREQTNTFDRHFEVEPLKELFKSYEMNLFLNSFGEWNNLFNDRNDKSDLLSQLIM